MARGDVQIEKNKFLKWSDLNCPFNRSQLLDNRCEGDKCMLFCTVTQEYGNGVWSGCCLKALAKQAVGFRLS